MSIGWKIAVVIIGIIAVAAIFVSISVSQRGVVLTDNQIMQLFNSKRFTDNLKIFSDKEMSSKLANLRHEISDSLREAGKRVDSIYSEKVSQQDADIEYVLETLDDIWSDLYRPVMKGDPGDTIPPSQRRQLANVDSTTSSADTSSSADTLKTNTQ